MTRPSNEPVRADDSRGGSWRRRGLVAGLAALAAAALGKVTDRVADTAYAADVAVDNLSVNGNITFTFPGFNNFRDIHTTGNSSGLRFYNADVLTVIPDGAAIQFWGNNTGLPGQAYIDSGANDNAAIILRTAGSGQSVSERFRIDHAGSCTITGSLAVSGIKAFVMDHPLDPANSYLYHSAVEAPEQLNVYSGTVVTNFAGEAVVSLPGYFSAVNTDVRYQLTVLGQFAQAIVSSKVSNDQFRIKTDKPHIEVCWQVTGVRNDPYARAHPFQPVQPKSAEERGYYLHPEVYGRQSTESIAWSRSPERQLGLKPAGH
jgi:hypothetical protein